MDSNNPIKYSDLVKPDTAITDLIAQLQDLSEQYGKSIKEIKEQASQLANSLRGVSGATEEGREATKRASAEADKLSQAEKKLQQARAANRQEIAKLTRVAREKNELTKLIEKRNKSAEGSYNRLSAQYSLNKIRLNAMSKAMREGTEEGRKLETETRKIYEEMKRLQAATGKMQLNVGNYPQLFGAAASSMGGFGSSIASVVSAVNPAAAAIAAVGIAMAGVAKVTKDSIEVTSSYNHAVSILSAITGESRDNLKLLTDQAREYGATTKYTATEVVQLQTELAKLGYTQKEIHNMTGGVLSFAQATGVELADAASLAGASLRIFNADSTRTQEFVDKMSASTTKSALNFEYLSTALSIVGPVANSFGFKIEDVLALLGQLANAGFDASSAATALRNIFLNLADSNGKLAKALGKPVTNLDELTKGLAALKAANIDLGAALELTDKRSVAAFSKFLDAASDARQLRDALNEANGAAKDMAKTMSDDLDGDVKSLRSAYDDLMITLGGGQSVWRNLTQWLTGVVRGINSAVKWFLSLRDAANDALVRIQALLAPLNSPALKALKSALGAITNEPSKLTKVRHTKVYKAKDGSVYKTEEEAVARNNEIEGDKKAVEEAAKRLEAQQKEEDAKKAKKAQADANKAKTQAEKEAREKDQRYKDNLQLVRKYEDLQLEAETDAYEKSRRKTQLRYSREIEELTHKLQTDKNLTAEGKQAITDTITQLQKNENAELERLAMEHQVKELELLKKTLELRIAAVKAGTQEEINLRMQLLDVEKQIALLRNKMLPTGQQQAEGDITAKYAADAQKVADDYVKAQMQIFDQQQKLAQTEFELLTNSEGRKTRFRLQAEKERIDKILEMNEKAGTKLTDLERQQLLAQKSLLDKQIQQSKTEERSSDIFGLLGLNIDDDKKEAANEAIDYAIGQLQNIMAMRTQAAEQAVQESQKEVDAAQRRLDYELQARANGYAANVEYAQKELDESKKNQQKAIEEKKKAQRQEQAIATIQEANNLVLASAKIWGQLGFPWAIPAIGVMWGSFAAAKIKAFQMTKNTQEYANGTVELLQGGSHASGNDIDLGTTVDGTNRRAEGGEFFAVINKRNSRKYRSVIPDVINAFNDGTFAEKYMGKDAPILNVTTGQNDLGELTDDVRQIRKQGEERQYTDANGNIVIEYKNRKRIIRK